MPQSEQDFKTHFRIIPGFHGLLFGLLVVNFVWSIVHVFKAGVSFEALWTVALAFALLLMFYYVRQFATRNQDRIIRLEMRVRLREMLPADLRGRVGELSTGQMIGLRFAGDAELPGLVRRVLEERIDERTPIKKLVTDWQPDFQRV